MTSIDLRSMSKEELSQYMQEIGQPAFRGAQLFRHIQKHSSDNFSSMSDIPEDLRTYLTEHTDIVLPRIIDKQTSKAEDTIKLLLELSDGERIEMVLMLYERWQAHNRVSCCVSCQSGCAMNCTFCASALHDKFRNLSAGEMIAQVQIANQLAYDLGFSGVTNIVFMGMGEPLANLAAVKKTIELLNSEDGMAIGMRRITVSTCGLVPKIKEMAEWGYQIGLAVSLHAANDDLRKKLMPQAARYSLAELIDACKYYRQKSGRRITVEYALFKGVNDSLDDAEQLAALLTETDILVNIIPANPLPEAKIMPPAQAVIEAFCNKLDSLGISVQLRLKRGADIEAACGQLRKRSFQFPG